MGSELGATSSIFPSDEATKDFMRMHGREEQWLEFSADEDAVYDETIEIDLGKIEPLIARPHSPDNVVPVREIAGTKVSQVIVGSCTNSSYEDLMVVAKALEGKKVHPEVSMSINPGSRRVYYALAKNGALATLVESGVRILELGCGPCCGMEKAPESAGVSVRTVNRNFKGRSGTNDALVYLASPAVAVACALTGVITDPRDLGPYPEIIPPASYVLNDNLLISPSADPGGVEIVKGPNIKPVPIKPPLENKIQGKVLMKLGDNITTDDIIPSGSKLMSLRSNIPAISEFAFCKLDETFAGRCKEAGGGLIVAGLNYGQGSSREHAALIPMYLGIKAVIAKSFARIHGQNLVNFGILPLIFDAESDYDALAPRIC
jgi:aconitate hydratase